jgi:glyoxylase-like metal-dependent hydrolase (beta-lactamase superfamily II)
MTVELIDLMHLGRPQMIGVYLLREPEPALVDCGPAVCIPALRKALAACGVPLAEVRHLLLTHIHPDHAGAAGALVRESPSLTVHVHEIGAPHLVAPERLEASARRLYGDDFDRLFGAIEPVPEANVRVAGERVLDLEVFPTPGHAPHHISFLGPDGACYAGDATGVLVPRGHFLYPASAPPGIDVEAWLASLGAIEERRPACLRLPHFGEVADPAPHVARMRERLREWAGRVEGGATVEEFVAAAEKQLSAEAAPEAFELLEHMPGFDLSYAGLKRYFDKRGGGD